MNLTDAPRLSKEDEIELAKRIEAGVYAAHLVQQQTASVPADVPTSTCACTGDTGAPSDQIPSPAGTSLSKEELLQVVRDGEDAWASFFTANMPLVVHMAASWNRPGQQVNMEDRVQEGSVALLKAMACWDYARGIPFGTFARMHINSATRPGLARTEVPLPDELSQATTRESALSSALRHATDAHHEILSDAWERLSLWQRHVLTLRFGLRGDEPCSYTRLAEHLGVSYREARRLERSALSHLEECSVAERYACAAV
ncbi:MAG: sigma-70 family RNA polymerase sigma factor [Propionibacteriaceae bacterium]|jgi:RNA polymerase sigma factor (sigma-70 family)|nr:sigma-70 family RNA polymerase sigma factor [Propionibacteriaceae bacterium]